MDLPRHVDCFGCGHPEHGRMDPELSWDEAERRIHGWVRFGPQTQGPPGHVHGGSLTTVLDECMGAAAWMSGHPALAASLTVNFGKMVRLGSRLEVEARVERTEGRKVFTRSTLRREDGTVVTEATGLFIMVPKERVHAQFDELERQQLLQLWQRQKRVAAS